MVGAFLAPLAATALLAAAPADESGCRVLTLPLSVVSRQSGQAAAGLSPADLRVERRGRRIEITGVERVAQSRVVVLIDVSGSMMTYPDEWRATLTMVRDFVESAPASLSIALATFADGLDVQAAFGSSRDEIRSKVARWESVGGPARRGGRTAALNAVLEAVTLFGVARPGDSILLVTDGEDNRSKRRESQLRWVLAGAGVRLFALLPDTRLSRRPERDDKQSWIYKVADATGGVVVTYLPMQRPRTELAGTGQMMSGFYLVQTKACEPIVKLERWTVEAGTDRARSWRFLYPAVGPEPPHP